MRKKPLAIFLQLSRLQTKAFQRGKRTLAKQLGLQLREFKQDNPQFNQY